METGSDVKQKGLEIPLNTYRAVIELYISFHSNDEFWYSNPPDSYLENNNITTGRGNGAYREVLVTIINSTVGSVIPFIPLDLQWRDRPFILESSSLGTFDLPSYDIELTQFLGMILDGKAHIFGLGVTDALSFWLVDANLHLWLDDNVAVVKAETVVCKAPSVSVKRKSKYIKLHGKFEIKVKRKSKFSGWVSSSLGNFTTSVSEKLEFKNKIKYKKNGTVKDVKQKVTVKTKLEVESCTGSNVYSLVNTQKANGTMYAENRVVLWGSKYFSKL